MSKMIFISGWAHSGSAMAKLAAALGRADALTLALSDLDSGAGSCPDYAAGLASRLAGVGGGPVWLVGWSTGGIVALEASLRWPAAVSGLVLISATPRFLSAPDFSGGVPAAELRAMMVGIRQDCEGTIAEFVRRAAYPEILAEAQIGAAVAAACEQGTAGLRRGLEYLRQVDCRELLTKSWPCPCLVLHGAQDRIVPVAAAEWLRAHLPSVQCRIWPEAGHNLLHQQFGEVSAEVARFLKGGLRAEG